jgi:short-subunit dehydrogenase
MSKPVAVITGASSGIGEVFARKLSASHDLLLVARREERLRELARELIAAGGQAEVLSADLSDQVQCQRVAERIGAQQNLALLVNNAGFGQRGMFWETDIEVQARMHRLHVEALLRLSHAALKVMVAKNGGAIINLASVAAFARRAGSTGYSASKSWVAAFTEGLYLDLKRRGSPVVVQALCPGYTYSAFHDVMREDRGRLAPPSMWLSADQVVDESLAALPRGDLYVIPGWRYRRVVGLLKLLPLRLRFRLARIGSRQAPAAQPQSDRAR